MQSFTTQKHSVSMGKKRSRLALATVASAIAVSVSAVGVEAFQSPLPFTPRTASQSSLNPSQREYGTRLNVLMEPDVLLLEELELIPTASAARPRNGSKKASGKRKVPPKITLRSPPTSSSINIQKKKEKIKKEQEAAAIEAATASNTETAKPKAVKKFNNRQRQQATIPGFNSVSDRQRAFEDGIKMVEGQTGRKLAKYVNTPEERKKRIQKNGSAMYKSSPSVPDSLVDFANQIHTVDRITPKQELELGAKTQEAIRLQNLHDDLTDRFNRPPTDEEWCAAAGKINLEALSQAIEDGIEAKNTLVTSNLRMVQGVVNLYIRNGLGGEYNAGDLMQEGIMALIRAAEKFDPNRGFRFSTYAMYWIRSAVKRSQIVQSRVITVPQRLYENHKRILRTERELRVELERKPTKKELSDAVGMSEVQVERCLTAMQQRIFSLDQGIQNTKKPMGADRSTDTLVDIIANQEDGEHDKMQRLFLREDLIETLHRHLSRDEVDLLLLRYGLRDDLPPEYGEGPMTIANVSQVVGLKPDKVRRMLIKSLKHLQLVIGDEWKDYEREFQF